MSEMETNMSSGWLAGMDGKLAIAYYCSVRVKYFKSRRRLPLLTGVR